MSRAQKNARRSTVAPSVQRQPTALGSGKGNGITKRTGKESSESATLNPQDMADTQARVIKTARS